MCGVSGQISPFSKRPAQIIERKKKFSFQKSNTHSNLIQSSVKKKSNNKKRVKSITARTWSTNEDGIEKRTTHIIFHCSSQPVTVTAHTHTRTCRIIRNGETSDFRYGTQRPNAGISTISDSRGGGGAHFLLAHCYWWGLRALSIDTNRKLRHTFPFSEYIRHQNHFHKGVDVRGGGVWRNLRRWSYR